MEVSHVEEIADRILAGKRKAWLRWKPLFNAFETYRRPWTIRDTAGAMPKSVETFLCKTGYGDIADVLSFRSQWIQQIEVGELTGHVIFAQDDCGNYYATSLANDQIHFLARSSSEYALMSESFAGFLAELQRRDFALDVWTKSLELKPYAWG
ncbi:MAG: hypothetical protein ACT6S0_27370 [Roseateles sp.]|uniref:hypothetical protein n=1 Tax=Roseateles sp. TaxID=1971397 RepID=UPI004036C340